MENINSINETKIHERQLFITEQIFSFCEKRHIKCFLTGGSLLGAIKYQRIIPGDKDVDIGMLREDYERFVTLSDELPNDLKMLEVRKCPSSNWMFAKVFEKGTRLIPKTVSACDVETGIYVDIIPYDYVEEGNRRQIYVKTKFKKWLLLMKGNRKKKNVKEEIFFILSLFFRREKLIQDFLRIKEKTGIVQNLVGGTICDWYLTDEISDLTAIDFSGVRVLIPKWKRYLDENYPEWSISDVSRNELKNYTVEFSPRFDLEILHRIQLELALEVKRICTKYSIPFFLVDGTALAAQNIGKFLPWDDDLDIGMYWPDYLKFIEACKTELPSRFKMKDYRTDSNFGCVFGQLINKEYVLIQENNVDAADEKGVFIDIHPFSNCSNFKIMRLIAYYRFKLFKLCLLERRGYMSSLSHKAQILKWVNKLISEDTIKSRILKMREKKQKRFALEIHSRYPEDMIVIENLKHLQTVEFEGNNFPIQPDAEQMLNRIYGKFDINRVEINRHKIISVQKLKN